MIVELGTLDDFEALAKKWAGDVGPILRVHLLQHYISAHFPTAVELNITESRCFVEVT